MNGVHFVVLVNVFNFEIDGKLGADQIAWVTRDLAAQKASTPIVVFGHVPLYALYPTWGWTTEDGATVLAALRRFDALTVLNGHIHQVIQHTEGTCASRRRVDRVSAQNNGNTLRRLDAVAVAKVT